MLENSSGGGGAKCFPAGWNVAAPKPCDSCKSAPASLFCRKDVVFLCMVCDLRLHNETRHERVWMCEVCEQSPAGVTCKADAALLCFSCDRDIHSVNPLARRHERVPVVPFYDSAEAVAQNSTALNLLDPISDYGCRTTELNSLVVNSKEDQVSWKIPMSSPVEMKAIDLFSETDILFDFGFAIPTEVRIESQIRDSVHDAVVPVQRTNFTPQQMIDLQSPGTRYDINFTESNTNSYSKSNSQSLSDLGNFQVSSTSMNVGVVPEQNKMLDVSYPLMLPVYGGSEFKWTTNGSHKATCKDRLARVLRYREKRKNRKYEKKIRYASRKAYADMRPRVKGRFAKRTEATAELDADRWLFTVASTWSGYGGEVEYGVVPSF